MQQTKTYKKEQKVILVIAVIFIVLGVGNMFFAASRLETYSELFQKTVDNYQIDAETLEAINKNEISRQQFPTLENRIKTVRNLKSKIDYYKIVEVGGKLFVAMAAILLVVFLLMFKEKK